MIYVQLNYYGALVFVGLLSSMKNYQLLKLHGLSVYWLSHTSVIPCISFRKLGNQCQLVATLSF
jgi:hypothetical protein